MSDDHDATLTALREREQELAASLEMIRFDLRVGDARLAELRAAIDLVQRGGKRKPGPKPGARLVPPPPAEEPPINESAGDAAA